MLRWWKPMVVSLILTLSWASAGCVLTGGGEVGVRVGVGKEKPSSPSLSAPSEPADSQETLEFIEDR